MEQNTAARIVETGVDTMNRAKKDGQGRLILKI